MSHIRGAVYLRKLHNECQQPGQTRLRDSTKMFKAKTVIMPAQAGTTATGSPCTKRSTGPGRRRPATQRHQRAGFSAIAPIAAPSRNSGNDICDL